MKIHFVNSGHFGKHFKFGSIIPPIDMYKKIRLNNVLDGVYNTFPKEFKLDAIDFINIEHLYLVNKSTIYGNSAIAKRRRREIQKANNKRIIMTEKLVMKIINLSNTYI